MALDSSKVAPDASSCITHTSGLSGRGVPHRALYLAASQHLMPANGGRSWPRQGVSLDQSVCRGNLEGSLPHLAHVPLYFLWTSQSHPGVCEEHVLGHQILADKGLDPRSGLLLQETSARKQENRQSHTPSPLHVGGALTWTRHTHAATKLPPSKNQQWTPTLRIDVGGPCANLTSPCASAPSVPFVAHPLNTRLTTFTFTLVNCNCTTSPCRTLPALLLRQPHGAKSLL